MVPVRLGGRNGPDRKGLVQALVGARPIEVMGILDEDGEQMLLTEHQKVIDDPHLHRVVAEYIDRGRDGPCLSVRAAPRTDPLRRSREMTRLCLRRWVRRDRQRG